MIMENWNGPLITVGGRKQGLATQGRYDSHYLEYHLQREDNMGSMAVVVFSQVIQVVVW